MKQNFVNEFHDNGLELEGFPEQKRNTCHLYGKINKFIIVRLWAWGLCDVTLEFNVRNFYKLRTDKTASRFSQLFHFFGTGLFRKLWMLIIVFFMLSEIDSSSSDGALESLTFQLQQE